jgi:predicted ATP-binding protein involved in virulence
MHPSLNVLVGENGAGKTSILEAIACGVGPFLTAMPDTRGKLIRKSDIHVGSKGIADSTRIAIETTSSLSWDLVAKGASSKVLPKIGTSALSNYANQLVARESEYPLIVYYGTSRALTPANSKVSINPFEVEARGDGYDSALDAKINYGVIKNWFSKIEVDELRQKNERKDHDFIHPAKKLVSETVHLMVKNAVALEFDKVTNDVVVYWKNSLDEKLQLNLEQLSDGYRNIVALTIDLVRRSYLLNPKRHNPLLVGGMVLIDEIELHLHPRWQQKVLGDLINLFPNVQFVVTTHSPQVLTTVRGESIRVIYGDSTEAEMVNSPFGGESNRVMQDILHVNPRPDTEVSKMLNEYFNLIELGKGEEEDALLLRDKLVTLTDGSEPMLNEADLAIKRVKWMNSRKK